MPQPATPPFTFAARALGLNDGFEPLASSPRSFHSQSAIAWSSSFFTSSGTRRSAIRPIVDSATNSMPLMPPLKYWLASRFWSSLRRANCAFTASPLPLAWASRSLSGR